MAEESAAEKWSVTGDHRLCIGSVIADAETVLASVSSGGQVRADLPEIRFSRRALIPRIVFEGEFPAELKARICVSADGSWIELAESQDNVVSHNRWHAVHRQSLNEIIKLLARHNLGAGPIDAGRYLNLVAAPELIPYIEDLTEARDGDLWVARSVLLPTPSRLNADLFPYQIVGSSFMRTLARLGVGSLLADDMGLGKTVQVISLIVDQPIGSTTLVVCPVSLLENWRREIETFAHGLKVLIHQGPMRAGAPQGFAGFDVVITPYGTATADRALMSLCSWDLVVLDEAQQIKNPDSERAIAIKSIKRRIGVAMTGTPVENSLEDLYSISEFVMPSLLGSRDHFIRLFPNLDEAAQRLGQIVSPVTIRRHVADVADDLPPLLQAKRSFKLESVDSEWYETFEASHPGLDGIQTLRVFCAHADTNATSISTAIRTKPKVEFLLSELTNLFANSEKAVVFASFQSTLDSLAYLVGSEEPSAFISVLDGRVRASDRQEIIDRFSDYDGPGCLLLNPNAAGTGLNITAANHVIHFNPEWNPQVTRQATARCFRRGQDKTVFVQHLYYADTIEERAMSIAMAKLDLAESVDDGIGSSFQGDNDALQR